MLSALIVAAIFSGPQVRLAPDQPLPYVFADEPVIVEFRGEEDLDFDVMLVYGTGQFPSNSHGLGPIPLRAGRPYWTTTNLEPRRFGSYNITLNLQWPDGSERLDFELLRIRRPAVVNPPDTLCRIPSRTGPWDQIRRVLPAREVSLGSDHPELVRLLETFAREHVRVRLLLRGELPVLSERLALDSVAIPLTGPVEAWIQTARRVREQLPATRTVLESPTPEMFVALLQAGASELVNGVAVDSIDALQANRDAAERQGYEGFSFSVYVSSSRPLAAAQAWNAGAASVELNLDSLWVEEDLTEAFSQLNASIHLMDWARVAGRISTDESESDGGSVLMRYVEPIRRGEWIVPLSEPEFFPGTDQYADANGNVDTDFHGGAEFALGANPDVMLAAVAFEVREAAKHLLAQAPVMAAVPEEVARAVERLAQCDGSVSMRAEFFALLRVLPTLEEAWHAGLLRKADAAPGIASIERLVLRLGVLEDALQVPFVEPIDETLERCAEQQALYLTATVGPGASAERGENMMMHISHLITEARSLHSQGRVIEADAVAALAEWRARSLVHAVKARPLTEIEPEPRIDQ